MDRDELAFAGAARQADMVRRGEVSSRELVRSTSSASSGSTAS